MNTQVLGISVDHVPCLKAWAQSLGGIHYPLLSDFWPHGKVANLYGVLRPEGYTERAIIVIDRNGIIQYVDIHDFDKQPSNEELRQVLRRIDPESAAKEVITKKGALLPLPHGGIVMYCTPWCPDCRDAKVWLKQHNLSFTEVNIPSTPGAEEQVRHWNKGALVTPTFDIDGKIIRDFDESQLRDVLRIDP